MSVRINSKKISKLKKARISSINARFVGVLIKDGKKVKATRIYENTLATSSTEIDMSVSSIVRNIVRNVSLPLEIKMVKRGKRLLTIPRFANRKRSHFLIARNLIRNVKDEKAHISLTEKLNREIIRIVLKRPSKTVDKNKQVARDAVKNKSFVHYRW